MAALPHPVSSDQLHAAYAEHFAGEPFVSVRPLNDTTALRDGKFLEPEALNDTNKLDNLGKGASGAAVQNLNLMLGLPERESLD